MGKSRKDYEKYLNSISPDRDDERWIIGGKNRYCGRENYGTMIKRYDREIMNEIILSNMLGCQTYCISDSPSNRYCLIGPIECNEKLIEVFKKGITVKLKYVEKRVLDAFTDNGIDLSNYTHCIIVKRNFYLAW